MTGLFLGTLNLEYTRASLVTSDRRTFTYFFKVFFFFFFDYYLYLAALGLCCYAETFSSCSKWGLLFVAVCGLLIASRCRTRALGHLGCSSCGTQI